VLMQLALCNVGNVAYEVCAQGEHDLPHVALVAHILQATAASVGWGLGWLVP
jgi:hypothetical protein